MPVAIGIVEGEAGGQFPLNFILFEIFFVTIFLNYKEWGG